MNSLKIILVAGLFFMLNCTASAQFKSLDFGLSISGIFEDGLDAEYNYDQIYGGALAQIPLGYTFSINNKMTFTARAGYAFALYRYRLGQQFSSTPNTINPNPTTIIKDQTIKFFKIGIAFSYWMNQVGKGFYAESELQSVFSFSAVSRNMVTINGGDTERSTVDFIDKMNTSVPSLKIHVGYNLPVKRFSFFIHGGTEFRVSTYFKSTKEYGNFNRSFGFGVRYALQNKME